MRVFRTSSWFGLLLALSLGCASKQDPPLFAPSSDQPAYAERYPAALGSTRERFQEQETQATELSGRFSGYPDELNDPQWNHVREVVDRADHSGRSGTYAQKLEEIEHVQTFFEEEEQELNRQVGGAVSYAAKQKGCDAEVGGAAAHGMKKAVEKQIEKRLREYNEAHRYIEEHEDALGKNNIEKLEKQADEIAHASYLANVGVEATRRELKVMIEEAKDVESTLDKTIEEYGKAEQDPGRSDKEKQVARDRGEAAKAAKARIESEVQQAQKSLEELEGRIENLKKAYEDALEALRKKIEEKQKEQEAKGEKSS
jgi:chromosome segregation ATPase